MRCLNCTVGHYCPAAAVFPLQCTPGTYNPLTSGSDVAACRLCEAGFACPDGGMYQMTTACAQGHYCAAGTAEANDELQRCPSGTFTDATNLTIAGECSECPAGYACPAGSTSATASSCAVGHYCPAGTFASTDYTCPGGTYSAKTRLQAAAECTECPRGKYCSGLGESTFTATCTAGYYCPNGTAVPIACPAGTSSASLGLSSVDQCVTCPVGFYCTTAVTAPVKCPAGSFTKVTGTMAKGPVASTAEAKTACVTCTAGSVCTIGATAPVACGIGKHTAPGASACSTCAAGHYCGSTTTATSLMYSLGGDWSSSADDSGRCFNGTYCAAGQDRAPDLLRDACPAGSYCPIATTSPMACPAGKFNAVPGQDALSDCETTPEGYYTLSGASSVVLLCSPGSYCPAGSTGPMQVACPERYYLENAGGGRLEACALCLSGGYCPEGSATPTKCPRGSYCSTGISRPEPCRPGTYGNGTGLRRNEDCVACDAGSYCDSYGLADPAGPCDPGYFCLTKSYTSAPHAPGSTLAQQLEISAIGGLCPAGGYCPLGSKAPSPCPNGTYNNYTGATSSLDCKPCDAGFYCAGSSNPQPTGPCSAGYFCLGGASSPEQFTVPPGFFSIVGATAATPCRPGTYMPFPGQAECFECEAGRFCDKFNATQALDCPLGFYCIEGTAYPEKCPAGTYGESERLIGTSNCTKCDAGFYCDEVGATSGNQKPCAAGFWCGRGSFRERPMAQFDAEGLANGGICPPGHYCPAAGELNPVACPKGTYSPGEGSTGNSSGFACEPSPPGFACNKTGLAHATQECEAGFFCLAGAEEARPLDYGGVGSGCSKQHWSECDYGPCPIGFECPTGTGAPQRCREGTYSPNRTLAECLPCPAGVYCDGSNLTAVTFAKEDTSLLVLFLSCPKGRFCPPGTGSDQPRCPQGTFGGRQNLSYADDCEPCPAGSFCASAGLAKPSGRCFAGFYCPPYAVSGRGATADSDFTPTAAPSFGPSPAPSVKPTGAPTHAPFPKPSQLPTSSPSFDFTSEPSSPPTFSRPPSAAPTSTPTAQPTTPPTLLPLPAPTLSPTTQMRPTDDRICPAGFFCPEGSATPVPCPNGTYSGSLFRLTNSSACLNCTAGFFCPQASRQPEGPCHAGFFCGRGSHEARPSSGVCPQGSACPAGSALPELCDSGTFAADYGQATCDKCPAAHFCEAGAVTPQVCPPGFWCPTATRRAYAHPCPQGTWQNRTGRASKADCYVVADGSYSAGSGNVRVDGPCTAGYYCLNASRTATPVSQLYGGACGPGYACPIGSSVKAECPAGFYCKDGTGVSGPCAAGYYCRRRASTPAPLRDFDVLEIIGSECPAGHFCPEQSPEPVPCPAGTFTTATGNVHVLDCKPCLGGYVCGGNGTASLPEQLLCPRGKYCPNGTGGVGMAVGLACPRGSFCPLGSAAPMACTAGSYQTHRNASNCTVCPERFSCAAGAVDPTICTAGFYCPEATKHFAESRCPAGSFSNKTGLAVIEECAQCSPGYYCEVTALTQPTGPCAEGFFCQNGSKTATPRRGDDYLKYAAAPEASELPP